ncbi:MAG TPA: phosphotransferase [Patescibacteria group bacterium]|nr:phosphotransferase [Patescibacteria group bacterium]
MKLTAMQVQAFMAGRSDRPVSEVVPLSGGEWSQAFGFKQAGQDLVVRFGQHQEDYLRDQFAAQHFGSVGLPIPNVLEVGEAFGGYYAVSVRAYGTMIDDLDKPAMRRVVPSLMSTMDAMRTADVSQSTGFGHIHADGNAGHASWYEVLLDVASDHPDMKIHGWKEGLRDSLIGIQPFEEAYAALAELARDLPEVRSLIHNDLINFNVLVNNDHITAVIDWANALYGDFLYDLAQFTFWGPLHDPVKGIDWEAKARAHYKAIGLRVPEFERRLRCCMIHMGLGAQAYYGYKKDWTYLESVAKRTLELAKK